MTTHTTRHDRLTRTRERHLVARRPLIGGYVVAAWLAGIVVNLLLIPGFYDDAVRDFGLLLAALALARLAVVFRRSAPAAAWPEVVS